MKFINLNAADPLNLGLAVRKFHELLCALDWALTFPVVYCFDPSSIVQSHLSYKALHFFSDSHRENTEIALPLLILVISINRMVGIFPTPLLLFLFQSTSSLAVKLGRREWGGGGGG